MIRHKEGHCFALFIATRKFIALNFSFPLLVIVRYSFFLLPFRCVGFHDPVLLMKT